MDVGRIRSRVCIPKMPKQPKDQEAVRNNLSSALLLMRHVSCMLALEEFEGYPLKIVLGSLNRIKTGPQGLKFGDVRVAWRFSGLEFSTLV